MKRKKSLFERVYGGTSSYKRILAINFVVIFLAWPFLSNVIALLAFYLVVYPLSLAFSFNPSFFFDVVFTVIYWPWTVYPVSVPVLFVLSYLVRRKSFKGKSRKSGKGS